MGTESINASIAGASTWRPRVQVPEGFYDSGYDTWDKWVTYHWVLTSLHKLRAINVLEIGVGSGVVTYCLRRAGVRVTTMDIDPTLGPDCIGSVSDLPFKSNTFDAVTCTEVLEHLPFEYSCKAIREIHRVTRRYALITVPHFALSLALLVRLPILQLREFRVRLPYRKPLKPNCQHYWEIGRPGYPISRLRKELVAGGFKILSEHRPHTNYSHCYFALEKTESNSASTLAD